MNQNKENWIRMALLKRFLWIAIAIGISLSLCYYNGLFTSKYITNSMGYLFTIIGLIFALSPKAPLAAFVRTSS
jgi:hypothetical protein